MFPSASGLLFALGSGASEFRDYYQKYQTGPNKGTSRAVFHCFCNALKNTKDPYIGGAPQLVGVYRKSNSNAIHYGVIYEGARYFLGAQIDNLSNFDRVPWRNINFELCDGYTLAKLVDAHPQPDPLRRH